MWKPLFLVLTLSIQFSLQAPCVCSHVTEISCWCDGTEVIRCSASLNLLSVISEALRTFPEGKKVKFIDCILQNTTSLSSPIFEGVPLIGLVLSSGDINFIGSDALIRLTETLATLGLPNNKISRVPTEAIKALKFLTRLDLSHNYISTLETGTFKDCPPLKVLDLSQNKISNISNYAFSHLNKLQILNLGSNSLTAESISNLKGLVELENLNLNHNNLTGPLVPSFIPKLPKLSTLNLNNNSITRVTRQAFKGLPLLKELALSRNKIDVIEDDAFISTGNIVTLDLSYNRIITVSVKSFAHLDKLTTLNLSHNVLRALTVDLVTHLNSLSTLSLDANEITMVDPGAVTLAERLSQLTVSGNPLNCDVSLCGFMLWLQDSMISIQNKTTAVCATPPNLENGYVNDLSSYDLKCDAAESIDEGVAPADGNIQLEKVNFDGRILWLLWKPLLKDTYECESIIIVEQLGHHAIFSQSRRLACRSTTLGFSGRLSTSVNASHLISGNRYQACTTFIRKDSSHEKPLHFVRCDDIQPLTTAQTPILDGFRALDAPHKGLMVLQEIWPPESECSVDVEVNFKSQLIEKANYSCRMTSFILNALNNYGTYDVCLSIQARRSTRKCDTIRLLYPTAPVRSSLILLAVFLTLLVACVSVASLFYFSRDFILKRSCHQRLSSSRIEPLLYSKLQTTTPF